MLQQIKQSRVADVTRSLAHVTHSLQRLDVGAMLSNTAHNEQRTQIGMQSSRIHSLPKEMLQNVTQDTSRCLEKCARQLIPLQLAEVPHIRNGSSTKDRISHQATNPAPVTHPHPLSTVLQAESRQTQPLLDL